MHGDTGIRMLELFLDGLYQCAKADRQRVFHSLHDKLCSIEILAGAWKRAKRLAELFNNRKAGGWYIGRARRRGALSCQGAGAH